MAARFAAGLLNFAMVAPASAAWTDEPVTHGWWMASPSLALRSDDKTGVTWSRWGGDCCVFHATDATGSWVKTRHA